MHVAVIGSGLLGVSTAYYLNQHGIDVTVMDRNEGPGLETSFANGAILTPSLSDPWNAPGAIWKLLSQLGHENAPMLLRPHALPSLLGWGIKFLQNTNQRQFEKSSAANIRLANYSMEVLGELRKAIKLEYDMNAIGTMLVCRKPDSLAAAVESATRLVEHGLAYSAIDVDEIVKLEPALTPIKHKLIGGIHYPGDEHGDAYEFCVGMTEKARSQGVKFVFGTTAVGFSQTAGKVTEVITDRQNLSCDRVVVAAGSYSPLLLRSLKLDLPVRPGKGYSITVSTAEWNMQPNMPVVDDHFHSAVTPLRDRVRVAGTAEFANYDTKIEKKRVNNMKTLLTELYPEAEHKMQGDLQPWSGFRPVSADGIPVVGATHIKNLYINTGHGHLGWTMAAGSGKLLADIIAGKKTQIDAGYYSLDRF